MADSALPARDHQPPQPLPLPSWSARVRNVAGGTALGFVNSILGGTRSIILLPLLLRVWSPDVVGLWLIFRAIFAWFSLGDLGFTDPTQILVSRWDRVDSAAGTRLFTTALWLFGGLGVALAALSWLGALFLPWGSLLHLNPELARQARTTFFWGGGIMGAWVAARFPEAVMIGLRQPTRAGVYRFTAIVLSLLTICICLLAQRSLALTFFLSIAVEALVAVVQFVDLMRQHKCFRPCLRFDRAEMRALLTPSRSFLTLKLTGLVFAQSGVLVITHYLGPAMVTGYAVTLRLAILWYMPASIGTMLLQQEVAPHWSEPLQRFNDLESHFDAGMMIALLVGITLALGFLASARPLQLLLIHRSLTTSWPTIGIFTILVFVMTIYTYGCTFVHASMQVKTEARLGWLLVAANLMAAVLLVPRWGVGGAAVAALAGYGLTYAWYLPWKAAQLVRQPATGRGLGLLATTTVLLAVGVVAFLVLVSRPGWTRWLACGLLPLLEAAFMVGIWHAVATPSNRAMFARLLHNLRRPSAPGPGWA